MDVIHIKVKLDGLADIMFDKFIDHSKENRPPEQKLYLAEGNKVVLPAENVRAFLFSENSPAGCAKTFEGKEYVRIGYGYAHISPVLIPFVDTSSGKPIEFKSFDDGRFSIYLSAGRTKASTGSNTIKQEAKPRPLMKLPWSIMFTIDLIKNGYIDENKLYNWFVAGGKQIALGTYRPAFGRFEVAEWDIK